MPAPPRRPRRRYGRHSRGRGCLQGYAFAAIARRTLGRIAVGPPLSTKERSSCKTAILESSEVFCLSGQADRHAAYNETHLGNWRCAMSLTAKASHSTKTDQAQSAPSPSQKRGCVLLQSSPPQRARHRHRPSRSRSTVTPVAQTTSGTRSASPDPD